mmetsp:Transcript_24916/g.41043  ORF Transcript_24916/g.41043 Transcript_24916/m.41043 type:complete len:634 (-) Transcript_24916:150-2051(-)|eukprot:CAMPEP_0184341942 /NCGR_PEP_ID=MMETSP1089-20130417/10549_1 /TAXON_ID=38269 ORGANISM="Gloeochaete wittrockiana, Strain SAG46.84" /NCGR_SAMPLE_ID=MMETSP1089 /ASSEMBLY_ACC=CAM_ASM_000445 /LENGTH=633 /DNA_ID=CAMNT_0026670519 /DNA_START=13 /DNA_END=1914 /DNA_ORIENTATION=-
MGLKPKEKGKKKKKKKSKKEIEAELERQRLEQEAAERAEQLRLEKERREQERLEKERREAEAKRREEELERLADEQIAVQRELQAHNDRIKQVEARKNEADTWDKYLECSERPKAVSESEINTYYNTWTDSTERGLQACMKEFQYTHEICKDIESFMADAQERFNEKECKRLQRHLLRLREVTVTRMDQMTADLIQRADEYLSAKNESQMSSVSTDFKYALWVNLAKNPRVKTLDFGDATLGLTVDIPKTLALASIAIRTWHSSYDNFSYDHPNPLAPLGPVLSVELLSLPPAARKVKTWTLRHVTPLAQTVQRLPYPIPPSMGSDLSTTMTINAALTTSSLHVPPLKISYVLPPYVVLREEKPRVAYWDADDKCWREEFISDVQYVPETRMVSFTTILLGHLALVQCRQLDLPFVSWRLHCTAKNQALLSLDTHTCQIQIQITEAGCALISPAVKELESLLGVVLPPGRLLKRLSLSGFHLVPVDWDAQYVPGITTKVPILERDAHYNVSLFCGVYAMCWSKWNQSLGSNKLLVRLQQDTRWHTPSRIQHPFQSVLFESEGHMSKCSLVQTSDDAETCNLAPVEDCVTHASLMLAMSDRLSEEFQTIIEDTSVMLSYQIQCLLNSLRLFSFS